MLLPLSSGVSPLARPSFSVAAPGLDFNDIEGCVMRCLAVTIASGSAIDDPISVLPDNSAGGSATMEFTNPSAFYREYGGKPVLYFPHHAKGRVYAELDFSVTHTIIARGRQVSTSVDGGRIFTADYNTNGSNWLMGWHNNHMDQVYANGSLVKLDGTDADFEPHTYAVRHKADATEFFGESGLILAGGYSPGPVGLGVCMIEPTECEISGIVVYNRPLSDEELSNAINLMNQL